MRLKMSSAEWRPFCLGLNVLISSVLSNIVFEVIHPFLAVICNTVSSTIDSIHIPIYFVRRKLDLHPQKIWYCIVNRRPISLCAKYTHWGGNTDDGIDPQGVRWYYVHGIGSITLWTWQNDQHLKCILFNIIFFLYYNFIAVFLWKLSKKCHPYGHYQDNYPGTLSSSQVTIIHLKFRYQWIWFIMVTS